MSPSVVLPSVTWRDRTPALALSALIVAFGLQPNWLVRWSELTTLALYQPYQRIALGQPPFPPATPSVVVADTILVAAPALVAPTLANSISLDPILAQPTVEVYTPWPKPYPWLLPIP